MKLRELPPEQRTPEEQGEMIAGYIVAGILTVGAALAVLVFLAR